MEIWVSGFFACLLVIQQAFFMWQIQKLVDKVMSRSYHEYVKATEPVKPRAALQNPDEREDLKSLNALTGFGL